MMSAIRLKGYAGTLATVAAALVLALALQRAHIHPANFALVFLTGVLVSAVVYGLWPALFACLVSLLVYNFFLLPPLYTFAIADPSNIVTLFFFAVVAVVASNLAARARAQAIMARQHAAMTESLYEFSRKLAEVFTLDDLLWAICFQIARMLKVRVVLLLPQAGTLTVRSGYPPEDHLGPDDLAAAEQVLRHDKARDWRSGTAPEHYSFLPLRTGRGHVGIVGLEREGKPPYLEIGEQRLLEALADQAALAIERLNLAQDMEEVRVAAETERLRSAMLTSISHDLRTPLASILGSASSLAAHRGNLDAAAQDELIATIREEAERLHRFIANLLDMTRLESGAIEPRLDLVDLSDVVGTALRRAEQVLGDRRIEVQIPPDMPLLNFDPVLFEQALFNLLDNAAKYTPPRTCIQIRAEDEESSVRLEIADEGDGIPPDELERIFDKFHRVQATDRKRAGTGLGLAICRGFVEAMHGRIWAANRGDARGAVFTISLPKPLTRGQERAA